MPSLAVAPAHMGTTSSAASATTAPAPIPTTTTNGTGSSAQDAAARRPSSAPGSKNNLVATLEQAERQDLVTAKRPRKPLLVRSKSEHVGLRADDADHSDDEILEWGARHGFEDHYQSEDIISHLANVSAFGPCSRYPFALAQSLPQSLLGRANLE